MSKKAKMNDGSAEPLASERDETVGKTDSLNPYGFLGSKASRFFDECGDLAGDEVDLLSFEFSEDASFGLTKRIIDSARSILSDVPPADVRAFLWYADLLVDAGSKAGRLSVVGPDGEPLDMSSVNYESLNQLDFIPFVLDVLQTSEFMLQGEDPSSTPMRVTPLRFCAAYTLRMAFNGTRDWFFSNNLQNYYLMQAAVAYGLMQALDGAPEGGVSAVIATSLRSESARSSANVRWSGDPKALAMAEVRRQWDQMIAGKSRFRTDAKFARDMARNHGEQLSEGGIKNAISRWRKAL